MNKHHRRDNIEWQIQRRKCFIATDTDGTKLVLPTDMPFEFNRLKFPVRLAFAMTINKAQRQSLQVCGLNPQNPCFSHEQLYVACSRGGKRADLFVYAPDGKTKNVVYPRALQ